jgi:hypothetical protein
MWAVALVFLMVEIKTTWEKLPEFPAVSARETSMLLIYYQALFHILGRFFIFPPSWFISACIAVRDGVSGVGRRA